MNRARRTQDRAAFTLLELMLAAVLGAMVVIFCMAMFGAMDRMESRMAERSDEAVELATAHRALARAFSNLLMTDQAEPGEDQINKSKKEDVKTNEGDRAEQAEGGAERARLAIQPENRGALKMGDKRPQTVYIALRTPPVYGGGETEVVDQGSASGKAGSRMDKGFGKKDRSSDSGRTQKYDNVLKTPRGPTEADAMAAVQDVLAGKPPPDVGGGDGQADDQAASGVSGLETEPARSVGVRGVFELLPDPPGPNERRSADAEVPWALWWREIAAEAPEPPPGAKLNVRDSEAFSGSTSVRRVRIMRNLHAARWSVYRDGEFGPKMSAVFPGHLPAYVQFQFETVKGRREDWVFEVGWSTGPEPGSIVPTATDSFNTSGNGVGTPVPDPAAGGQPQK